MVHLALIALFFLLQTAFILSGASWFVENRQKMAQRIYNVWH